MTGSTQDVMKHELLNHVTTHNFEKFQHFFTNLPGSDADKKLALDHSFRDILQHLVISGNATSSYCLFLNFAILCVRQDICSPSTLFVMLSDLFDMIVLDDCFDIFYFVEEKVETWKCDAFYNAGKNYLLRMCNDLLRRLSKSKNTVFCGRIQLFLARLFPLEEKSGLNLMSNFNLENVTVYNAGAQESRVGASDDVDQTRKSLIDYNLYEKFWSLQDYFHRPMLCYDKTAWKTLVDNTEVVMSCFESYKLDDVRVSFHENVEPESFFEKYLTSDKLLNLQLSDSNFRRNVLVQFLILFQYLTSHVRFKLANQVLNDDQTAWVRSSNERVFRILSETPPDGARFAQIIEHTLNREENWNSWKNEGCSSFIRKKIETGKTPVTIRKRRRNIANDLRMDHKIVRLGNPELTRLWNLNPDNDAACKSKDRNFVANFDEFFGGAIEQLDPSAGVEDQYKLINEPTFAWKSLRLLAAKSPHFFAQQQGNAASNPIKTTSQYLEQIIGKHAKEIMANANSKAGETEDVGVEYNASLVKKEIDLTEGDNSSTDQEQSSFEQFEELMAIVGGDWRVLAACLNMPREKIKCFEEEEMSTGQIFTEITRLYKELLHTVTPEKVEMLAKSKLTA